MDSRMQLLAKTATIRKCGGGDDWSGSEYSRARISPVVHTAIEEVISSPLELITLARKITIGVIPRARPATSIRDRDKRAAQVNASPSKRAEASDESSRMR